MVGLIPKDLTSDIQTFVSKPLPNRPQAGAPSHDISLNLVITGHDQTISFVPVDLTLTSQLDLIGTSDWVMLC